jgi:putative intracellular protease/amidase
MRTKLTLALICLSATAWAGEDILLIIPHRYGANYNFNRDQLEKMGWLVTTAAVADTVQPCYGGLPWLAVDTLLSEIEDVSAFDAVAVMSASWRYQPDPYGDIISSPEAMGIITDAVLLGIPFYAPCAAPRVLAAADLLDGVSMQGEPGDEGQFLAEYLAAGADYLGTHLPPVIFGNIVTATRGQYYQRENCQAIGTAMITGSACSPVVCREASPSSDQLPGYGTLWSMTYGGTDSDGATDIVCCDDGGFAVSGYTWSFGGGNSDMLLVRTNQTGDVLWSRSYGGCGWERANSLDATSDGGFILAGYTTSQGEGLQDILVVRVNCSGDQLWSRSFGGPAPDIAMSVIEDNEGGIMVCGYTESMGAGEDDIYLLKLASDGELLWERTYGGNAMESGDCVIQTQDGDYLLAGATGSSTSNSDAVLIKVDGDGDVIWTEFYDGAGGEGGYDRANSVCSCDGGFALAGDSNEPDLCGVMLVKVDQEGSETLMDFYGDYFYDYGTDIVECGDGGFMICGVTKDSQSCLNSIYAVKTTSQGVPVWEDTFGDSEDSQWAAAICRTADDCYAIAGQTSTSEDGCPDILVIKIDDPMAGTGYAQSPESLEISPNPAVETIRVGPYPCSNSAFRVYDLSGRCVLDVRRNGDGGSIDISGLPPGAYCMVCGDEAGARAGFTVVR